MKKEWGRRPPYQRCIGNDYCSIGYRANTVVGMSACKCVTSARSAVRVRSAKMVFLIPELDGET